ncbi:MAG: hypothetical protein LBU84_15035 [Prevotella sp.]|nr:hypothetical protein [Prevotella sp.]
MDTIYVWITDDFDFTAEWNGISIKPSEPLLTLTEAKNQFYVRNGVLYNSAINKQYTTFAIAFFAQNSIETMIYFRNGKIEHTYFVFWKQMAYDENGNLTYITTTLQDDHIMRFSKGNGYYRDFQKFTKKDTLTYGDTISRNNLLVFEYFNAEINGSQHLYDHHISSEIISDSTVLRIQTDVYLKEEGQIEDNYKVGTWKYYNKGKLDHVTTYRKKDKVDVRFPYCLFNRTEPCYP